MLGIKNKLLFNVAVLTLDYLNYTSLPDLINRFG